MAFEGPIIVYDGPEQYHKEVEETPTKLTDRTIMVMRGAGPLGSRISKVRFKELSTESCPYLYQASLEVPKWSICSPRESLSNEAYKSCPALETVGSQVCHPLLISAG